MRLVIVAATALAASILLAAPGAHVVAEGASRPKPAESPPLDVLYFPTPQKAVDKMLEMAGISDRDFLIDLGCGDGRIPITAAKRYGARGLGVDLDPERISDSNANARAAGVQDKVSFREQDLFETDLHDATVVTLFLLGGINAKLRPHLLAQLKPGSRVVAYNFYIEGWKPDRIETVDGHRIFLWRMPPHPE